MLRCEDCDYGWVPQGVARDESGRTIYEDDTPIFLRQGNEEYYLDENNLLNARLKLEFVSAHHSGKGRLLDIGANFGHFLRVAGERFDAGGLEPSSVAVEWARKQYGVEIEEGSVYELATRTTAWDIITLWDVIEHLERPREALRAIRSVLETGGKLFLSTPDFGSWVARIMGRHWHYVDPLQHIALFDRQSLSRLLNESGFRVGEIRSMSHVYRIGYIQSRLRYLYSAGILGSVVHAATAPLTLIADRQARLGLGDVMGVAAEARSV